MGAPEFLQWLNLAIIPGLLYIVKLERRLMSLELKIGLMAGHCTRSEACQVRAMRAA